MLFRAHDPLLHIFMGSQPIPGGFFWHWPGIFRSRLWRERVICILFHYGLLHLRPASCRREPLTFLRCLDIYIAERVTRQIAEAEVRSKSGNWLFPSLCELPPSLKLWRTRRRQAILNRVCGNTPRRSPTLLKCILSISSCHLRHKAMRSTWSLLRSTTATARDVELRAPCHANTFGHIHVSMRCRVCERLRS